MRLYAGTSRQFIADSTLNQIAEKLKLAFEGYYRHTPSPNEVNSWRNSLRAMSQVLQYSNLLDNGITLEYQLPLSSKRLDCMVCGKDSTGTENAVIIELKQWDKCKESDGVNEVMTYVGGAERDVLHPSAQVFQYRTYLEDCHTAFYGEKSISLSSCSYLHNYHFSAGDVIFAPKFETILETSPLFLADDVEKLSRYLVGKLDKGEGEEVLAKIEKSKYRPSKKLMQHVSNIIANKPEYVLLDEQLIVYDKVVSCAKKGFHDKKKFAIIIKGGPGTGKSVIAINLMAGLLKEGYNTHYATGSKAFTETLRSVIGTRGSSQFKYFNSYMQAEANAIDVLICDEAHRMRKTSNNMYTPAAKRSNKMQIEEIVGASKVSVFFIDDDQVVRPDEIGSIEYIKKVCGELDIELFEFELETQFRCNGSAGFVNWINNTLAIKKTPNILFNSKEDRFEFKIFDSPDALEQAVRKKVEEGNTGRMTAGFCWKWSQPTLDGLLVNDLVIGEYSRPWNAKPDAKKLAKGIPKAPLWAYDPAGIGQVGCIYTAQGFEFDYAGVIFGKDLRYNMDSQTWEGFKEESFDTSVKRSKEKFTDLVKNTYRVLLSRGMKGCYVYFMDKDTERFFKSRIE